SGSGVSSARVGTRRVPHFSQKTLWGELGVPHCGQRALVTDGNLAPQSLQKRDPSRLAVPQLVQYTMP
ncbi:MAG TPA: hypothetical protein VFF59_04475, partial [Anaerolineae bacterium]|nr:hypothetical protein [Anaerolineae bacterium]